MYEPGSLLYQMSNVTITIDRLSELHRPVIWLPTNFYLIVARECGPDPKRLNEAFDAYRAGILPNAKPGQVTIRDFIQTYPQAKTVARQGSLVALKAAAGIPLSVEFTPEERRRDFWNVVVAKTTEQFSTAELIEMEEMDFLHKYLPVGGDDAS